MRMVAERLPDALSADAFGERVGPFRRELLVHCYRMLGSIDDAEDAVQDALARAWNGRHTFRRDISFRAWLYRIATNTCLDAIGQRGRVGGRHESLEVSPVPDDLLGEPVAGPEALYDARESISLAFLTALQLLPPRQRAVLILRDVLAWRANEVAALLEISVPAANGALHRARATVASRYRPGRGATPGVSGGAAANLRTLLNRYVRAWESADIPGLVALLREDAVVSMPPGVLLTGAAQIRAFLASTVFRGDRRIRLVPVRANGETGFVVYSGAPADSTLRAYAITLVGVDPGATAVARISVFADPAVASRFEVPETIPG